MDLYLHSPIRLYVVRRHSFYRQTNIFEHAVRSVTFAHKIGNFLSVLVTDMKDGQIL